MYPMSTMARICSKLTWPSASRGTFSWEMGSSRTTHGANHTKVVLDTAMPTPANSLFTAFTASWMEVHGLRMAPWADGHGCKSRPPTKSAGPLQHHGITATPMGMHGRPCTSWEQRCDM